jgi:hydrogenase nickel incorporation protein HypA/HybF
MTNLGKTAVMHEASLMTNLMRRIDELAKAERARRVIGVSVWLGALSHMSAEHLAEHFEQAAAGTIAEGARLDVAVSGDTRHANAQDIVLESVEVET